jgi:hypothetical protein
LSNRYIAALHINPYVILLEHSAFQLKEFRKQYESYVPMEYKVYLKRMKRFLLNNDLIFSSTYYPGRYLIIFGVAYVYIHMQFSADLGNGEII